MDLHERQEERQHRVSAVLCFDFLVHRGNTVCRWWFKCVCGGGKGGGGGRVTGKYIQLLAQRTSEGEN